MLSLLRVGLVDLEPSSEGSVLGSTIFQDIIDVGICIEVHQLLILQMNRESVDSGFCIVHGEFKDVVAALY
jgi:hypothetical protein